MELYAKGQLSFLILNCLQERDFYGLDFISEIYKKSNTVDSSLNFIIPLYENMPVEISEK